MTYFLSNDFIFDDIFYYLMRNFEKIPIKMILYYLVLSNSDFGQVAELVDAQVSKTCDLHDHEGSSPSLPMLYEKQR